MPSAMWIHWGGVVDSSGALSGDHRLWVWARGEISAGLRGSTEKCRWTQLGGGVDAIFATFDGL